MSEIKQMLKAQELMNEAACECMSPDQMDSFEELFDNEDLSGRFLRCVMKRFEPAAYMVRHKDFRDNESLWRCIELKFADKYKADDRYDMRPLYAIAKATGA